jgi:hypothetical protein
VTPHLRAALASAGRVFLGGVIVAFLAHGEPASQLDLADLRLLLDAGVGALAVTAANALRRGESRFGRGATPDPA